MRSIVFAIGICLFISPGTRTLAQDWQAHSIDKQGRGADGLRFRDVNNDGLLDLASGWEEAGETRVYLHPGTDKLRRPWPKVIVGKSGPVEDAVFCDLDRDGVVDVVSASENRNIYVHWAPKSDKAYLDRTAWETAVLPSAQGVHNWMITVPLQIDGKNGPDLLAAGKGNRVVWFESPPDARDLAKWKMHVISEKGGWTMGLVAVDMDGDGDQDALLGIRNQNPGVKWLENPGPSPRQEQSWKVHDVGNQDSTGFVTTTDLDQDGLLDVLAPLMGKAKAVRIFRGLSKDSTKWETIEIALPNGNNKGIAVGDIDLDGRADLVVSHVRREYAQIYVLQHDGEIGKDHWHYRRVARGGKFDDVTLYDVDGDGDLDVFTTDERGLQVVWYENPAKQRGRTSNRFNPTR